MQVFGSVHRQILVRAVQAADRDTAVGLNEKHDRSSNRLTFDFLVWNHDAVTLQTVNKLPASMRLTEDFGYFKRLLKHICLVRD